MNSALRLKNSSVKMHEFSSPAIELLCKNAWIQLSGYRTLCKNAWIQLSGYKTPR
jgi:hypothetical protein